MKESGGGGGGGVAEVGKISKEVQVGRLKWDVHAMRR